MSKYFQALIVFLYVLLTIFSFLLLLTVSGVHLSHWAGWSSMLGWVGSCWLSVYVVPAYYLFRHQAVRKATSSEGAILLAAFSKVAVSAGVDPQSFVLKVEESMELNAFATGRRTIVVTKGLLQICTPDELRGVLAHELGHLVSGDTVMGT